jgi:thiamine-phosphate pyrophosphorylase
VSRDRLERLRGIYPLADDDPRWRHGPRDVVRAALEGGATVVQLRLKHTPDREAIALARWAAERTRQADAILIVNDRLDVAEASGADGVHLGEDDLPPESIPREVRERLVVGLSTHSLEQVTKSRERPVDYIAFGPVFGTTSKASSYSARGVPALAEAVRRAGRPLVAIGGITAGNLAEVRRAGAQAAALISAIADAPDPAAETARLQQILREGDAGG